MPQDLTLPARSSPPASYAATSELVWVPSRAAAHAELAAGLVRSLGGLATSPTGASQGGAGRRRAVHVERVCVRVLPSPPPCSSRRHPSRRSGLPSEGSASAARLVRSRGARAGEEQERRAVAARALGAPLLLRIVMGSPVAFTAALLAGRGRPIEERVGSRCRGRRGARKGGSVLWMDDEEGMAGAARAR
jgi:hypothetical protein